MFSCNARAKLIIISIITLVVINLKLAKHATQPDKNEFDQKPTTRTLIKPYQGRQCAKKPQVHQKHSIISRAYGAPHVDEKFTFKVKYTIFRVPGTIVFEISLV